MLKAFFVAFLAVTMAVGPAFAEERPACPSGDKKGWHWSYDEDHIWLTDPAVEVNWTLVDNSAQTTTGVTLVWSYSKWSENEFVTYQRDGEKQLMNGVYFTPPPTNKGFPKAFVSGAEGDRHDFFKQLDIGEETVVPFDFEWESTWNPKNSQSVYVGNSTMPGAGVMNAAFLKSKTPVRVSLKLRGPYQAKDYATGTFKTRSVGKLIDQLKPKMEAEAKRAKESGVYCVEEKH